MTRPRCTYKALCAVAALGLTAARVAYAETPEEFLKSATSEYEDFLSGALSDYEDFRSHLNDEYARLLAEPWEPRVITPPRILSDQNPLPPVVLPDRDALPDTRPVIIDDVIDYIESVPRPQPQPPSPIKPDLTLPDVRDVTLTLYGTPFTVQTGDIRLRSLANPSEKDVATAWREASRDKALDTAIASLLKIRDKARLNGWAYYNLVRQFAASECRGDKNAAAFLTGYIMAQSGYGMRFGYARSSRRLHALMRSDLRIIKEPYYLDERGAMYFPFENVDGSLSMPGSDFGGAMPLDLDITRLPDLAIDLSDEKRVTAVNYPEVKVAYRTNRNLLKFFDTYPAATFDKPYDPWSRYALTPMSEQAREAIYPVLTSAIAGKSKLQAANVLLNFCQSYPYAYDSEVWGGDRAFFPDETLYYPGSDCEDHAILFARLVRDLLHLPVALVHYPEHLAAAVAFDEDVAGAYIMNGGRKYVICDPTIFYAPVGRAMRDQDSAAATLILLPYP